MNNSHKNKDAPRNPDGAYAINAELDSGRAEQIIVDSQAKFDKGMGESSFERIELKDGGFIDLNRVTPPTDMSLEAGPLDSQTRITSMMMLVGETSFSFPGTDRHQLNSTQGSNFRSLGEPATFELAGGKEIYALGVTLIPDIFVRYLNNDVPKAMRPMLAPREAGANITPFPISTVMRQTIINSVAPGLTGTLKQMQMEGAALLFISQVARALESSYDTSKPSLTKRERSAAQEAHERLCAMLRDPPTLSEMSDAVGLTEKRLNTAFRELYGGTVFEVLRAQRLEQARELLEQGDMAIKEIAWNVGYTHTSNFSKAFTNMFGFPPATYARSH